MEGALKPDNQVFGYFSEADLLSIKNAVVEAEKNTSGEIRVVIRASYSAGLKKNIHEQARHEFEKYGLGNTRDKTGVLILLVLEAKKFVVWGDDGIHAKVSQEYWNVLALGMKAHFRENNYAFGVCGAVKEVGRKLAEFFPKKPDDINELSDDVIVEGEK